MLLTGVVLLLASAPGDDGRSRSRRKARQRALRSLPWQGWQHADRPQLSAPVRPAEDYLVHSLRAYKQDARKNPIMGAQAKLLSRDDILNLAAYYSRLPGMMNHKR